MGGMQRYENAGALAWVGPIFFLCAIGATTIVLWSDREWLEMAVDQQFRAMICEGTDGEISRRALETAIDTGAMGYFLAVRALWIVGRSHILFLLILLLLLSITGGGRTSLRAFSVLVGQSYMIPAVGVLLNALLRWHSVRMNATFSPGFFIESYDGRLFWHQLSVQADLFVALFFARVGFVVSKTSGAKPIHFIGLIVVLWFIANCAAHFLNIVFELAA
jgi:hypothetical protein